MNNPPGARVLIAEDDYAIADNLHTWLDRKGYAVEVVYSGRAALHRVSIERFDVILLDIGLPGLDGLTVLQRLRGELRVATPVLVITARSDLADKLAGFENGADDYVTKPFALAEVEVRVRALLERAGGAAPRFDPVRRFGRLGFDVDQCEASVGTTSLRLTPKTAQLLELLLRLPGKLVRRADIEQALWNGEPPQPDAVRAQVHALRRALAEAGFDGIDNVHGVGYRLVDRSASGAGDPRLVDRSASGAGDPRHVDRSASGAGDPQQVDRSASGAVDSQGADRSEKG